MAISSFLHKYLPAFGRANKTPQAPYTRQQRLTALVMLILTSSYLVIELAFNARLLDVVGSLEGGSAVESIEKYGRLISGTAVALLILGKILGNAAKKGKQASEYFMLMFSIILFCGSAMVAVYIGQKKLVDGLVNISTDEHRRRAAVLVPMGKLIKTGLLGVPGLDLNEVDYQTAAGKTFLATFPLQTMSHPNLFQTLEGNVGPIFRAFSEQERRYNEGFFDAYLKSQNALKEQYDNEYATASRQYRDTMSRELPARQQSAWHDYEVRLTRQRRNLRPDNVPRAYWPRVRNDVRAQGVDISSDWVPSDRSGFNAAIARRYHYEALDTFHRESLTKMKVSIPLDPGLSFDEFLRHPAVLQKWKTSLNLQSHVPLRGGLNADAFNREVYGPSVDDDVKTLMTKNYAPAAAYGERGVHRKTGEDAYRALIVPPVALVFSLMGAMTHIFKVMMFIRKIVANVSAPVYWGAFAIYLALVATIPLVFSNKVTQQPLFEKLETYTRDGLAGATGLFVSKGIRWVTQFQPYFNPVNEFVRTSVLPSPRFDGKISFLEHADH